jgi:hypothetical protein
MIKKIVLTGVVLVVFLFFQGLAFGQDTIQDVYELPEQSSGEEEEEYEQKESNDVYSAAEVQILPSFPMEKGTMSDFINRNLQLSENQKETKGRVYVSCVIEKNGSITNVKIVRGINPDIDIEVVRVMGIMPKWTAGYISGIPVRVRQTLVIKINY